VRTPLHALACGLLAAAIPAAAQDALSVGSAASAPGVTVSVPIFVRDVAGTTLDEGDGPDLEIQGYALRVDFAPPSAVAAVAFQRYAVTAAGTPTFEFVDPNADNIVVLLNFDEGTDPLAFVLDRPAPGDVVGRLRFTLDAAAAPGTVTLSVAAASATLVNDSATLSETVANGMLALGGGTIEVGDTLFADGFETGTLVAW
jgi:hypothetical protein